jgi:uncharacterized protein YdeI (YjbR/CyaY-like superfamily)
MDGQEIKFFATPASFRAWLKKHHAKRSELIVGFYKKDSGRKSITWPESVEQALCFGWIDGVRRSLGEDAYSIRFTPRRATSIWSQVNLRKMEQLIEAGLVEKAGLHAYAKRNEAKTKLYSFEKPPKEFDAPLLKRFKSNKKAWSFWEKQPPGYRKILTHWVMSAKQEATRERRLASLIETSADGARVELTNPFRKNA